MDEFLVFFQQWQMDSFYELNSTPISFAYCEDLQQPNNGQQPGLDIKRPAAELTHGGENIRPWKQLKTTTWSSCKTDYNMSDSAPPSSFHVVNSSFNVSPSPAVGLVQPGEEAWASTVVSQPLFGNQSCLLKPCQGPKRTNTITRLAQSQDHILAERKRREKLTQRFIACLLSLD